jgi:hypothetical protein
MSLLSEIKTRLAAPTNIEKAMAEASTGKALKAGTPKGSGIQEQVAQEAGMAQLDRMEGQANLQQASIAQESSAIQSQLTSGLNELASKKRMEEQSQNLRATMAEFERGAQLDESTAKLTAEETIQVNRMAAQFDMTLASMLSERKLNEDSIWNNFERENKQLAFRKDAASLEQLGFSLRLRDQQYVDQLTRIGKLRRLENENEFRKEFTRLQLGNNLSMFLDDLGFKEALYADQRTFEEMLAKINPDMAMRMATNAMKDASTSQIFQGVGTLASTGVTAYGNYKADAPKASPDLSNQATDLGGGAYRTPAGPTIAK